MRCPLPCRGGGKKREAIRAIRALRKPEEGWTRPSECERSKSRTPTTSSCHHTCATQEHRANKEQTGTSQDWGASGSGVVRDLV